MVNRKSLDFKSLFNLFLEHSDNLCFILTSDLVIKNANVAALQTLNLKRKDVFNQKINEVFKEHTHFFINADKPIRRSKKLFQITKENRKLEILWDIFPIRNKNKAVECIFVIGKLIDSFTEKEMQYLQLENVVKYAPGFFYWKDRNSVYLGCNDEFASLAGLNSRGDVIGKTDNDLIWKDRAQLYINDDKKVIKTGKPILNREEKIIISNSRTITAITNKVPVFDSRNKIIGLMGITTDITQQKMMAEALSLAKNAAESANVLKTNFIQNMQHDIRTPASSVWAVLDNLVENNQMPDRNLLILLRDSSKQLLKICNDVIDFDRIEQGEMPILSKRFDLREVLNGVIELNHIAAIERNLTLLISIDEKIPRVLKGDEYRLSRILINLMGNAMKFTSQGYIKLTASLIQESKRKCVLQCKLEDTGIGIPLDKQNTLYEKFNRLNPANQNTYTGSGLGLRIVKKYVDDLEGEINVKSEVNKGTTFFIDLPFEKALVETVYDKHLPVALEVEKKIAETPMASYQESIRQHRGLKVLLIEDTEIAMKVAKIILDALHYNVSTAVDLRSSLEILQKVKFDVVISDIGLPDGTGIDLIKMIKKDQDSLNQSTPFFALTANADRRTREACEAAGFLAVMEKPMHKETILSLVSKFAQENVSAENQAQDLELIIPEMKSQLFDIHKYVLCDFPKGLKAAADNKAALETRFKALISLISNKRNALSSDTITENKWEEWREIALQLQDSAMFCGTTRLLYAAFYLEHACKEKFHSELIKQLAQQLITVMQDTKQYLDAQLMRKGDLKPASSSDFVGELGIDLPSSEAELFQLEQYSLFDKEQGIETIGDEDTLIEILSELVDSIPQYNRELREAHEKRDWESIEKLAHKYKGGAAYAGTIRMRYACQYLERYRKAGHFKALEKLFKQLITVLDETEQTVTDWFQKNRVE